MKSLPRRNKHLTLILTALPLMIAAAGCSDDDDDFASPATGGVAGSSVAGSTGDQASGGSGAVSGTTSVGGVPSVSGGSAAAGAPDLSTAGQSGAVGEGGDGTGGQLGGGAPGTGGAWDGTDLDVNVQRPEELPFDQSKFDGLTLPTGFTINVFRSGLGQARMLAANGGYVYVTEPTPGDVLRLNDANEDGVAESQTIVAEGLPYIHGIVFNEDQVYLADVNHVYRADVASDGSFGELETLISDLPDGGQHPLRTLGIGPDGLLYISIGSDCNACPEPNPEHATLLRSPLAGAPASGRTIFAKGLRNTIGFGWQPATEELWGMDHGSDDRGDEVPPEELNHITVNGDYGWPYCYGNRKIDPIIQDPPDSSKAAYCAPTLGPVLTNRAHEAPIGLTFYEGSTFPEEYQNGAFIALHGSWNRAPASGYEIAFIAFEAGQPTDIVPFVSGFLADDTLSTFARPTGVTVAEDGALLFSDDSNGIIYRVQYE